MRQRFDWLVLVALVLDSIALALLEIFFLPLRFDGRLLPDWGAVPFPVTAVVALITMPLMISSAGRVSTRLLFVGAPLWVWLITIAVVGIVGPENMVLLEDWRTLLLLACGALPAAVTLGNALARRSISRAAATSGSATDDAADNPASRTG